MTFFKICFFILFLTPSLFSQSYVTKKTVSGKAKKVFDKVQELNRAEQFDKALVQLDKLLDIEPTFIDAHILKAAIHHELGDLAAAEKGFEYSLNMDAAYQSRVIYMLAMTEMRQDKFEEAVEHFEQFLQTNPRNESLRKRAGKHAKNCRFMAVAFKNPVDFNPQNIGTAINTNHSEYLPALTADSETLIFTRRENGDENFFLSKKEDDQWQEAQPMSEINTPLNEGAQSITADGKFLVFTACNRKDGLGSCDIYFSEVKNGHWTAPANMGSPLNSSAWESQPSISANGNALYFSSNRKGGQGEKDIWVSFREQGGPWQTPVNLRGIVNTPDDDQSPFLHADGQTLYFMSEGHPGMGGHDLFLSRLDENNQWATPENLGYPINTEASEGAFVISLDGTTAYFATDRLTKSNKGSSGFDPKSNYSNTDIYTFTLPDKLKPQPVTYVKGIVRDADTKKKLADAEIEITALNSGTLYASTKSDEQGGFLICLPAGNDYALNVSKRQYLFYSDHFSLSKNQLPEDPYLLNVPLIPLPVSASQEKDAIFETSKPVILKNIFFETASAELRNESVTELKKLLQFLNDYPDLRIQINGHTDNVGSEEDNRQLSGNRAKAVYTYLNENGIDNMRLQFKGYGETQPIDSNETPEGRQNNRRTEFEVVGK